MDLFWKILLHVIFLGSDANEFHPIKFQLKTWEIMGHPETLLDKVTNKGYIIIGTSKLRPTLYLLKVLVA